MADKAHRLTDLKLEEMEKRLSAIYSNERRFNIEVRCSLQENETADTKGL